MHYEFGETYQHHWRRSVPNTVRGQNLSALLSLLPLHLSHLTLYLVSDRTVRGQNAILGHIARLPDDTPAHQAVLHEVNFSTSRPPDHT